MTAPDPRLDEIEARLAAATPGPWEVEDDDGFGHKVYKPGGWGTMYICEGLQQGHDDGLNDAEFIAAAPADVAYLLAELRKAHEAGQYALDIVAEGYPRHVGPFPTRADAERWMEGRRLTGSWNVYPMIRAAVAAANGDGQ